MQTNLQKKILFVDENPEGAESTLKAFAAAAATDNIIVVHSAGEVYDYLNYRQQYLMRPHGFPVLILLALDAQNPESLEVLRMIKPQLIPRNISTVILASAYEETLARESYELGANSYIVKPADFIDYVKVIKNLVGFWLTLNEQTRSHA